MTNNKAREINSPIIEELINETSPEELAKIDTEMSNNKQQTTVEWFLEQLEMINKIYHFESVEYFKARQKVFEKAIKMYNETYGGGEQ
jgi:hypothetical protein